MSRVSTVAILAMTKALVPWSASGQRIVLGPEVQVSKDHADRFHGEVQFAIDPHDPNRLVGGSMMFDPVTKTDRTIVYGSFDGGGAWRETLLSRSASFDPSCAYGPDGTAYFATMESATNRTEVYRSMDGGKTWLVPVSLPTVDRSYVLVDDSPGKFSGRVYLLARAHRGDDAGSRELTLWHSTDGGVSFSAPVQPASSLVRVNPTPSPGVVLSEGTVGLVFLSFGPGPGNQTRPTREHPVVVGALRFIHSTDGGRHLSAPVEISKLYLARPNPFNISTLPYLAVDRSQGPFHDRLYAMWVDERSGRTEVYLSRSSDRGVTWSRPRAVNDDAPRKPASSGPDDFQPAIAVNSSGVVGVSWYDRRDHPDDLGWTPRFTASLDGGVTFLPSVALTRASYQPKQQPSTDRGTAWSQQAFVYTGGDGGAIAVGAGGVFHTFWIDTRTGVPQIWTSAVTVQTR